jgi:apolipoprotein N-acyltransferase
VLLAIAALLYSGLVQAVMAPPLNWVALHPFSWVPAFWVFSRLEGRRALLAGWLVGICAELAIYYWLPQTIERYGGLPRALAALAWLLFAAGTAPARARGRSPLPHGSARSSS